MGTTTIGAGRKGPGRTAALAVVSALVLSGCGSGGNGDFFGIALFSESSMGVSSSPRAVTSGPIPRGGGRYQVGQPYQVGGRWYEPREQPNLDVTGVASWYGPNFHGRYTANGEVFDQYHLTGAHPTLPLPSYVRVTNLDNGVSTLVRINDRGPFSQSRVIDLSRRTAEVLGFTNAGTADVRVQYVGPAPLEGDDASFLVASINAATFLEDPSDVVVAYQGNTTPGAAGSSLDAIGTLLGGLSGTASSPVVSSYAAPSAAVFEPEIVAFDVLASHDLAFAGSDDALQDWSDSLDADAREVEIGLGTFVDAELARDVAERFALLAAVDSFEVTLAGQEAVLLKLSYLKPGVTHDDVSALARELGLSAAFF